MFSPYTPGELAPEVPGRDTELDDIADKLAAAAGRHRLVGRIRVETGARGVGKTSLLRQAERNARDDGWETVFLTAGQDPLVLALADALAAGPLRWSRTDRDRFTDLQLSFGPVSTTIDTRSHPQTVGAVGRLEDLIRQAVAESLGNDHRGLVIFIDELQMADVEGLRTLLYAWQHFQASPEGLPLALIGAGLSHTEDIITEAASFAERISYVPVEGLDDPTARQVITLPASRLGVTWATDAVEECITRSEGYPYFLQIYGDEVWEAAQPSEGGRITFDDVRRAEPRIRQAVIALYRSRWTKATKKERKFLTSMAMLGETAKRSEIAEAMGHTTTQISMVRQSLLDKGLIEPATHGVLRYTVPGFRDYVLETQGHD